LQKYNHLSAQYELLVKPLSTQNRKKRVNAFATQSIPRDECKTPNENDTIQVEIPFEAINTGDVSTPILVNPDHINEKGRKKKNNHGAKMVSAGKFETLKQRLSKNGENDEQRMRTDDDDPNDRSKKLLRLQNIEKKRSLKEFID